ncbi:hypothetical protein HHE014_08560 [Helicobacter heilmannii]|nr:hypothetical protein HHE014_08560 [Helicobacter heilmannii]
MKITLHYSFILSYTSPNTHQPKKASYGLLNAHSHFKTKKALLLQWRDKATKQTHLSLQNSLLGVWGLAPKSNIDAKRQLGLPIHATWLIFSHFFVSSRHHFFAIFAIFKFFSRAGF